jgi:spore germination cell wall hydrolase CwlJ-like protein
MKYLIPFTLIAFGIMSVSTADQGQASTIVLQENGKTLYLTDSGKLQTELFTREQDPEAYCLAENIYFESRSDSLAGQAAVADVVLNRLQDKRYPNTICDVVHEGPVTESWKTRQDPDLPDSERIYNPVRNMCQFSWYCDGKAEVITDKTAWNQAQYIAYQMLYAERYRGITEGATHYHADYVNPKWAKSLQFVTTIDSHKFYRWN